MGNFYVSFALRDVEPAAVAASLQQRNRKAFVTPVTDGFLYIYDEQCDSQDAEEIERLATELSGQLATAVLAVLNHDDDMLVYWLCDKGELIDTYNSFPGCFGTEEDDIDDGVLPRGGDAAKLVRTLGAATSARKVHEVLRADNEREEYVFAVDRHIALANLLGLRAEHCYLGYRYVVESDPAEISDRASFVEVK